MKVLRSTQAVTICGQWDITFPMLWTWVMCFDLKQLHRAFAWAIYHLPVCFISEPIITSWTVLGSDWLRRDPVLYSDPMTMSRGVFCSDWLRSESGALLLNQLLTVSSDLSHVLHLKPIPEARRPQSQEYLGDFWKARSGEA